MAHGAKRAAISKEQNSRKKSKTSAKKIQLEEQFQSQPQSQSSSPLTNEGENEDEDVDEGSRASNGPAVKEFFDRLALKWDKEDSASVKGFREKTDENDKKFAKELKEIRDKLSGDKESFESGIIPIFIQALAPMGRIEAPAQAADASKIKVTCTVASQKQQAFVKDTVTLTEDCFDLIKAFRNVVERDLAPSRLADISNMMAKDKEDALAMIDAGQKYAAQEVNDVLADRYNEVRRRPGMRRQKEELGRSLMSRGEKDDAVDETIVGFGELAHDIETAVGQLANVAQD